MKYVVFISLLSLSLCLSQTPTDKETGAKGVPLNQPVAVTPEHAEGSPKPQAETKVTAANETKTASTPTETDAAKTKTATETDPAATAKQDKAAANEASTKPVAPENKTANKTNEEATKANETKPTDSKVVPAKEEKDAAKKNETDKAAANGIQTDTKKNETSTEKAQTVVTTANPKDIQPVQARAFDGPSFFGGIILTLGLLAIGFMGYKYYKNQTERNYHTL